MHFVHIDIKEHPWMGVILGLFGMVFCTFLVYNAVKDYMVFSKQQTPELVDVENLYYYRPSTRKWVSIPTYNLQCKSVEKIKNTDLIEKYFHPVYSTYAIITDELGRELLVATYSGDASCVDFLYKVLTGVLTSTKDTSSGAGFWSTEISKKTQLNLMFIVGDGLENSRRLLITAIIFDGLYVWLVLYSGNLCFTRRRTGVNN